MIKKKKVKNNRMDIYECVQQFKVRSKITVGVSQALDDTISLNIDTSGDQSPIGSMQAAAAERAVEDLTQALWRGS
jgi:hypothetical protein